MATLSADIAAAILQMIATEAQEGRLTRASLRMAPDPANAGEYLYEYNVFVMHEGIEKRAIFDPKKPIFERTIGVFRQYVTETRAAINDPDH